MENYNERLDAELEKLKDMVVNGNSHEKRLATMTLSKHYFLDRNGIKELIADTPREGQRRRDLRRKHREK